MSEQNSDKSTNGAVLNAAAPRPVVQPSPLPRAAVQNAVPGKSQPSAIVPTTVVARATVPQVGGQAPGGPVRPVQQVAVPRTAPPPIPVGRGGVSPVQPTLVQRADAVQSLGQQSVVARGNSAPSAKPQAAVPGAGAVHIAPIAAEARVAITPGSTAPAAPIVETLVEVTSVVESDVAELPAVQAPGPDEVRSVAPVTPLLNADGLRIDPNVALRIPANLALRRSMLAFATADKKVLVACANPADRAGLDAVERYVGMPVQALRAEPEALKRVLQRVYPDANAPAIRPGAAAARGPEADDDAIGLTDEILRFAILRQASDIHIEPRRDQVRIRLRVDGQLEELRRLPTARQTGLISRLKVLSGMDIAEKRASQDGAFTWSPGTGADRASVDIRAATVPVKYGERMTLRILNLQTGGLTLQKLGMSAGDLQVFARAIEAPHGLILMNGPTGSGKTTTLYAAIREMDCDALNIVTVEDPIEYEMEEISQVGIDSAEKVTFAKVLRSVLRHDPDVVMVGEIRDLETADVAIKAGLTGHLVFSTLHTNSAPGAVTRLIDMGVPAYLVAATLRLSAAQRLVRRLCGHCRKPRPLTSAEAVALGRSDDAGKTIYDPGGCAYCGGRGYAGRTGVYEIMTPDEELSELIVSGAPEGKIREVARAKGMRTLRQDAAEKVIAGVTSVAEAIENTDGPFVRERTDNEKTN